MRYYLEIFDENKYFKQLYKESDDYNELKIFLEDLKDSNGKNYYVDLGEHTGFVGENSPVESTIAIGKQNLYPMFIRLNKDKVEEF
ncbi:MULTISPECIES: hypothetical protein [Staphylococcus]|uniref:Uncharacterized protein n=1 Tax=Staphylococcus shinii TaxID=2912228 RepID=A0A418IGM3_9STAP|nr:MULTISPECIES: hypothetical protein [Staphylococcus]RIN01599.1 hypothetical protein BU112_05120 [Staphylococcus shinii]